jgi:hypothetical protein
MEQLLSRFKKKSGYDGFDGKNFSINFVYGLVAIINDLEEKGVSIAVDEAMFEAKAMQLLVAAGGQVESED